MRGHIRRRGRASWEIKFDAGRDPATGRRLTRFTTIRGKRQDDERELTRLLQQADNGALVDPSKVTVAEYVRGWLDGAGELQPKTLERYRQLADQQIIPHLGAVALQKLRPAQVSDWHGTLAKSGGKDGRPLSGRTVGHAHRVLHRALARALRLEIVTRNVAAAVRPPRVTAAEIEILTSEQMATTLAKLDGHDLYPIAALALASGMRRGELVALRWGDIDLAGAALQVERSLEQTKAGLRFKPPKTRNGRRSISLPASAVDALREHRKRALELRLVIGAGKLPPDALVFGKFDGSPRPPDGLSSEWRHVVKSRKLPKVSFHALRHSHASALIAADVDVLTIARRLGHASAAITLAVYGHLFRDKGDVAAKAIEVAMRTGAER